MHESKPLQSKVTQKEKNLIPPDGGWGWVVLFGGFSTMVLASLTPVGFSILFSPVWRSFHTTSTTISWIFNIHVCTWSVTVLVAGPLCEEFGWRKIAFIGGIINSAAVICSAFAPSSQFLFFSYSVLGGIGGSLGMSASTFIVPKYFLRRRGFALAIMTLGVCIGSFASPLLSNFLLDNFGFKGACLILGGFLLNQCVAASLYQPVKRHLIPNLEEIDAEECFEHDPIYEGGNNVIEFEKRRCRAKMERHKLAPRLSETSQYSSGLTEQSAIAFISVNESKAEIVKAQSRWSCLIFVVVVVRILKSTFKSLNSLRSLRVIFIAVSSGCLMMGYVNFQMWIPLAILDAGYSLEMSAWCLSITAITNTVARVVISLVVDCSWFKMRIVYIAGIVIISLSIAAFPMKQEFVYLVTCASCWGLGCGMAMSLFSTVIISVVGEELFPTVFGVCSLTNALYFVVAGPIVGMIQDATSDFRIVLWILSIITFAAALLWSFMPHVAEYDRKREKRKSRTENIKS